MKKIPNSEDSLVLRTDFSDDLAWERLCANIQKPLGEFQAYVNFLSDPEYEGITVEELIKIVPENSNHTCIFIVDKVAISHPEHPILVVDLYEEPGRAFRVIPSQMCSVENNLSIANMDFYEFADDVDEDGIFRDFSDT